ncbi:MAG: hypothetical protein KY429_02070 [Actinobacteria bacterium]|nr:hypothetical protein [Actinomycetota bacterium]
MSVLRPILVVSGFTLLQHSRRKLIAFFLIGSAVITAGGIALEAIQSEAEMIFGPLPLAGIVQGFLSFFATIAVLTVSMGNFNQSFKEGEATIVLSRPVGRWQYTLGRLLASVGIAAGLCIIFAAEVQIVQIVAKSSDPGLLWAQWGVAIFNFSVLVAIASLLSAVIPVPILVAIVGYFAQLIIGGLMAGHRAIEAGGLSGWFSKVLEALYYITPKFLNAPVDPATVPAEMRSFFGGNSAGVVIWAVAYLAAMVLATIFLVNRKEV